MLSKLSRWVDLGFRNIKASNELAYHCFEIAHLKNHEQFFGNSDLPNDFEFMMEDFGES